MSTFTIDNSEVTIELAKDITSALVAGTQASIVVGCNVTFTRGGEFITLNLNNPLVKVTKVREEVYIPEDYEAFDKINDAVREDIDNGVFAYGEKYSFYQISDNTWRKATMERTSSDIGRLMAGFTLPVDASEKRKKNRLNNLNKAYNLGLTKAEIDSASRS